MKTPSRSSLFLAKVTPGESLWLEGGGWSGPAPCLLPRLPTLGEEGSPCPAFIGGLPGRRGPARTTVLLLRLSAVLCLDPEIPQGDSGRCAVCPRTQWPQNVLLSEDSFFFSANLFLSLRFV